MSGSSPVAIATLGRPELCAKTVTYLTSHGIDPSAITVFLSDPSERPAYADHYTAQTQPNIVDGVMGITPQRNLITRHYPDNAPVVGIDDDITLISQLNKNGKLQPINDLAELFTALFNMSPVRLWGIDPTGNPFYMKNKTTVGWKYAVGCLHGYVTDHSLPDLTVPVKEDYERSALYYEADGGITRFHWLTTNNRYGKTPNGCGLTAEREERNRTSAAELINRWPYLFAYKKDSDTEIRCKLT